MIDQGGNQGTTTKNNLPIKISGHRSGATVIILSQAIMRIIGTDTKQE